MQRIYKRGACYWVAIKLGPGKWVRKSTGKRDKKAAEHEAQRIERALSGAGDTAAQTLRGAIQAMIAQAKARGCAEGTLTMYATKAGHWLRIAGEDEMVSAVDAALVDRFIAARQSEGASKATIGKELTAIRQVLKTAKRRGWYKQDLDAVLPEKWDGSSRAGSRALTRSELDRLLLVLAPHRAAHVAFLVATGADWTPSLSAVAQDVELGKGIVHVRGTKTAHRARSLPIVGFMHELLARALQDGESPKLFRPWANVRHDLEAACRRAQIPRCTPRDMRRTFGTWLREAGVEPHLIARMLGHSTSAMVERVYGRLTSDALGDLMRARVPCEGGVHGAERKGVAR